MEENHRNTQEQRRTRTTLLQKAWPWIAAVMALTTFAGGVYERVQANVEKDLTLKTTVESNAKRLDVIEGKEIFKEQWMRGMCENVKWLIAHNKDYPEYQREFDGQSNCPGEGQTQDTYTTLDTTGIPH